MPFSEDLEPAFVGTSSDTFGNRASLITPGTNDQLDDGGRYYKYIVAASAGEVTFVGYHNDDTEVLTMSVLAGQTLPGRIRRITSATADLHGWSD